MAHMLNLAMPTGCVCFMPSLIPARHLGLLKNAEKCIQRVFL